MMQSPYVTAMRDNPRCIERSALKVCPFCGGKARIKTANVFADSGYRALCGRCGVGTAIVIVGEYINWRGENGKSFSDDEAVEEAARIWNERAEVCHA